MINEKIMIALCVRDVESHLPSVIKNINKIRSFVSETKVVFVESDSSDNTVDFLKNTEDVDVISEGNLESKYKERTCRISHCRNIYLDEAEKSDFDYLLVIDGDDAGEEEITEDSLSSNFNYDNWDMMTANQPEGYYDLWALRHNEWMPFDCWDEFDKNRTKENFIRCVTSRFKKINESEPLIKVDSAFGGAGLIKISSIQGSRHHGLYPNGKRICEWVPFCTKLKNVYINPKFVNSRKLSKHVTANMAVVR